MLDQRILEWQVLIELISGPAPVPPASHVAGLLEVGKDSERRSAADLGGAFDLADPRFGITRDGEQDLRVIRQECP